MWIEARVPQDGTRIDVGGTRLHVLDRGEGPIIVLIHGLMGQMRNFAPELIDALSKDHRVILVDRPGSGYSDPLPAGANGIASQADLIASLIEQMELEKPTVVGHSLGGAVAISLALDHPNSVGSLALIAPATRPRSEANSTFGPLAIEPAPLRRAISLTFGTPFGLAIFERSAAALFAPEPLPADFATAGGGLLSLRPENYIAGSNDIKSLRDALADLPTRYGQLEMPVGVLFGSDDQVVDKNWNGIWLKSQLANATYAEIEGGHMIPFSSPQLVADWIAAVANRAHSKTAN
ncbi:hypothetical protein BVC71_13015 [Marivivens niveibacter]|uniref:AB hydrolase-1 domain-containing protein n=1 Tax=Marivivens niveibacter TaxID=1930667 RepID=A0A251WWX5_9RHOB|nr:hypothetical protein BVC71_13015 [Marivivens niveibacter]